MFIMFIKTYDSKDIADVHVVPDWSNKQLKSIALRISTCILFVSLAMFALFDFSTNQFQFVLESQKISSFYFIPSLLNNYLLDAKYAPLLDRLVSSFNLDSSVPSNEVSSFNFYLGVDGLSIYFVLLTTIIMPVSLLSNWTSISHSLKTYLMPILLLETLLLSVFLVLDILFFYIFFESILPPLFILIGSFGSSDRVRASFYLFLYTLLGSLFLLLSIVTMSSRTGITDFDALFKINFNYFIQLFLFWGIFIAFAVKTPIIFLNSWLLKAHVQSPLSGSIILAGIVLKLSFYGILRLILPLLPKAYMNCTFFIYLIGVITIVYASVSTLRTIDVKELIAYSSVSHAAVYLMGVFSKTIQGIEGGIALALAHGFVSSGLFICVGGALYDRSSTRLITYYRGIAQMMPIFSVILFILCLGNCGVPLTLNFVGEFLSLYGAFERSPILGALASSSIIFSAAYTIYMFNRIAFAGSYSKFFIVNIPDLNKREFYVLLSLVLFTVALGIYPAPVLDGLHYSVTTLIYSVPNFYIINIVFKSKSLCQWKLNSPPKPHAFLSLPLQSGLFNFVIKRLNKRLLIGVTVGLGFSVAYRIPIRIMLDNLDIAYCYPLVAALCTVLTIIIVNNMLELKTKHFQWLSAAAFGAAIAFLLIFLKQYTVTSEFYQILISSLIAYSALPTAGGGLPAGSIGGGTAGPAGPAGSVGGGAGPAGPGGQGGAGAATTPALPPLKTGLTQAQIHRRNNWAALNPTKTANTSIMGDLAAGLEYGAIELPNFNTPRDYVPNAPYENRQRCVDIAAALDTQQRISGQAHLTKNFFGPHERFVLGFLYHKHRSFYDSLYDPHHPSKPAKWANKTNTYQFKDMFLDGD